MARRWRRPRSRGLGKRAWLVTWSNRLVLWTPGFTRIIRTEIVNADVVPANGTVIRGIFPEGKCAKPGEVLPYRPGVAVLSKDTNVPIIPVRLVNANKVLPLDKKFPSFGRGTDRS